MVSLGKNGVELGALDLQERLTLHGPAPLILHVIIVSAIKLMFKSHSDMLLV